MDLISSVNLLGVYQELQRCRMSVDGSNITRQFTLVSVTIRGITWFALGVKNEVFCIAQKTIAHEGV